MKKELAEDLSSRRREVSSRKQPFSSVSVIDLSDDDTGSSSNSDSASEDGGEGPSKRRKIGAVVPKGFLAPLPLATSRAQEACYSPSLEPVMQLPPATRGNAYAQTSKQFWKAGDYDGGLSSDWALTSGALLFCFHSSPPNLPFHLV